MKHQAGNALFLILIAVALFAALSYAITQSGRGGSGVDREQAQITAAQIVQKAAEIERAVNKLKIINGCSENLLSFWADTNGDGLEDTSDISYNSSTKSNGAECYVFKASEGGAVYSTPPVNALDTSSEGDNYYGLWYANASNLINGVGSDCADSACTDLVFMMPYVKDEVCKAINSQLGLYSMSDPIPQDEDGIGIAPFTKAYNYAASRVLYNSVTGDPDGVYTGCYWSNHTPGLASNVFFHVLIAR